MLTFLHAADLHLTPPSTPLPRTGGRAPAGAAPAADPPYPGGPAGPGGPGLPLRGDLFDSQRVRPETLQALHQVLEEMEAPVFLAPGNHDPYTDASPLREVPLAQPRPPLHHPPPRSGWPCPSWGRWSTAAPSPPPHRMEGPLTGFHAQEEGAAAFGCFHGDLSSPHSRYGAHHPRGDRRLGAELPGPGPHPRRQRPQRAGKTYYAFGPAAPRAGGFDETGDKGCT